MADKKNKSAIQLWEQIFSNLAKQENAALWDPDYDTTKDEAKFRAALKEAGWSEAEIQIRIEADLKIFSQAPRTSPGVSPWVEAQLDRLCSDVEAAMERLKLSSQYRVAHGVEPRLGPYAAKTNVIMTEESIISVGAHMFRFCGLVARAYTRTLHLNPFLWGAEDYDEKLARKHLRSSPELMRYWMRIYLSYALTGTNFIVPFLPANKAEAILFEQVARAMEIFAISHEYGHHHFEHGKLVSEEAHQVEFEADQFALQVCYEVERVPLIMENPYLSSGAGGVVLLLALETLRGIEDLVEEVKKRPLDSHPDVASRIERFDSVAVLKPVEFKALKGFRIACERILTMVESELLPPLKSMPPKLLRGIPRVRFGSQ